MQSLITLKNINKTYNKYLKSKNHVLHDINLEIKNNDFLCIMGPSGSGKTTLLNVISLIDSDYDGYIFFEGINVKTMSSKQLNKIKKKDIGFVFQNYNLLDNLTIKENIEFVLKINNDTDDTKITSIADKLGICSILEKYPYECSGGQQQLSAIARALIESPKVIFADEPTGNLDVKSSEKVMELLTNLNQTSAIIVVTHDIEVALYAKKVIYIEDGKILDVIKKETLSNQSFRKTLYEYVMNR